GVQRAVRDESRRRDRRTDVCRERAEHQYARKRCRGLAVRRGLLRSLAALGKTDRSPRRKARRGDPSLRVNPEQPRPTPKADLSNRREEPLGSGLRATQRYLRRSRDEQRLGVGLAAPAYRP